MAVTRFTQLDSSLLLLLKSLVSVFLAIELQSYGYLYDFDYILCIVPLVIYSNADLQKKQILKENRGKLGIYR